MVQQEPFPSLGWMWALREAEIEPQLRALAYVLMSYADEQGRCRPTVAQLALRTPSPSSGGGAASEPTVKRYRKKLVDLGWIELVKKGPGRGLSSVYQLTFPDDAKRVSEDSEKRISEPRKNGSHPLQENGSGVIHQVRHQVITTSFTPKEENSARGEGKKQVQAPAEISTSVVGKPTTSVGANSSIAETSSVAADEFAAAAERAVRDWSAAFRAYEGREPDVSDVGDNTLAWFQVDTLRLREMAELPWVKGAA